MNILKAMKRLLIVEPEEKEAHRLLTGLRQKDLELRWSRTGGEALDQMRYGRFDAVLSAMEMAPPDGLAIVQKLRGDGFRTPVLLLSNHYERHGEVDGRLMRWGRAVVMPREIQLLFLAGTLEAILQDPAAVG